MSRFLKWLFVNGAVLLVGVLLLEGFFGGWFVSPKLNRLNILRSVERVFEVDGLYDSDRETATYTRDAYGLRGSHARPSAIDMLTVGGSTTDQRYLDDEQTWQAYLEEELRARDVPATIGNAGVDGQTSFGHIKSFEWWFPELGLKAGLILFYIGLNDFYFDEPRRYDEIVGEERVVPWRRQLHDKSALAHVLRTVRGTFRAHVTQKINHGKVDYALVEWSETPLQSSYDSLMAPYLAGYESRLRELVKRTRAMGAEPIFATSPTRNYRWNADGGLVGIARELDYHGATINGVDFYHMMRRLDAVTGRVAQETGVPFFDYTAALESQLTDAHYYDHNHMTPAGAKFLAEAMADDFEPLIRE